MKRPLRAALAIVVAAGVAATVWLATRPPENPIGPAGPPREEPAPERAIRAAAITRHLRSLETIARNHGGNRAAGTEGEQRTTLYIAQTLRKAGWKVREQTVRWPYFENRRRPILGDLTYREDFVAAEYSGSDGFEGRVRPFDSQGCDADALGDLGPRDIAVVARGTCTFRAKALAAQRAGAGALVVVDRKEREPVQATLGDPAGITIPVLAATGEAATRLTDGPGDVRILVDTVSETRETRNVIAETEPRADGEVAMAGAHLDSVEAGPGINDNGSGVAALLEIARRTRDVQGLRLGFWTAEELGLFGSRHYVRTLPKDVREKIRAYLNLDMVGTPKGKVVVYDTDDDVEETLRDATAERGEEDLGGDSDHAPFDTAGIPVGGIFTGLDRCYHRACDTIQNTDATLAAAQARAAQEALTELAR
ncbi:MAG: Aminopeptidase Y (Arg, Lys, Leu preference) [uncultured Solirubrobacteraceae bacterium]|uniref:Aminopeptidase Y (Arg, Lys, Leu preference) n=1 Tax=uncultured Solirubrobacteraceae bacterium TaxID=1162706 RepID=A0A6J4T7Z2_9ACTN|nr:MAG: Aminopeptidase Y (Arg, Lys, Leu preference) [uncultured Solirubrobacteraceae bacterium]